MAPTDPQDFTRLLDRLRAGETGAETELLPEVYAELRRLARARLASERADHTLQATALVHEAYLRLAGQRETTWENRAHFLALAATAIRRVLVDHARARGAAKRGGGAARLTLAAADAAQEGPPLLDLLDLDDALGELAREHPERAQVVEMRFFGGLTAAECAEVAGVTERTVERRWRFARAWLYRRLAAEPPA